jgi:hypothetical protein
MTGTSIDTKAAVEVAKGAAGILPPEGKIEVLDHLVSSMTPEVLKALSPEAREKLLQALTGTEAAPSATTSPAVAEVKSVDGHQAVVGKVTVNGQQLDTLLSEGSFNRSRSGQHGYAAQLGFRMATREENRAYVEGLLAKEGNDTINDAEKNALNTYRVRYVRDTEGGHAVAGRRVRGAGDDWGDDGHPHLGALFVRGSAESK